MSTARPSARGRGSFLSATTDSPTLPKKSGNQESKKPTPLAKANLQMRPELYRELKTYAAQKGVKVYEAVEEAIQAYLSERRSA